MCAMTIGLLWLWLLSFLLVVLLLLVLLVVLLLLLLSSVEPSAMRRYEELRRSAVLEFSRVVTTLECSRGSA